MPDPLFLSAAQATAQLNVKPATLYAYVSRGLVRSEPGAAGTRERRYHAQDIQTLLVRQGARRDPQAAVEGALDSALDWGGPVLDSALTRISDGVLTYRGQDALALSATATVEEIAALLWTDDLAGWTRLPLRARLNLSAHPRASVPAEAFAYALTHAGAHDVSAHDARPEAGPGQAARVLNLLYATLERHQGVPPAPDLPLHARLARAWGAPQGADLLRRALVLLADHELNVSTFAARVTASGGASLQHATLAALCALQGPRHGLAALDAHELITHARRSGARAALRDATRRHSYPPGFGHRLYPPQGDPRARALLTVLVDALPRKGTVQSALELQALAHAETGEHANVDLALAALAQALGQGPQGTLALFALARATGWLAHALESQAGGGLIRPRARYVGR